MIRTSTTLVLCTVPVLGACAGHGPWTNDDMLAADALAVELDAAGRPVEMEFEVPIEDTPAEVRAAMEALHPGGGVDSAEREITMEGASWAEYWELSKEVDGREVSAKFEPSGKLVKEEFEVPAEDVPEVVREAAARVLGDAEVEWEAEYDATGVLTEYEVDAEVDGQALELSIAPDGTVLAMNREIPADIQVPLP
jgi:hypothetical protein